MADGQSSPETWLPAADAAAQTGVPLRTLHRWAKARAIRSKTQDG